MKSKAEILDTVIRFQKELTKSADPETVACCLLYIGTSAAMACGHSKDTLTRLTSQCVDLFNGQ